MHGQAYTLSEGVILATKVRAVMRILIIDEQPLFREALATHLEAIYPGSAVFEVSTLVEAQGVLEVYANFALIVLDISVPDTESIAWVCALRSKAPESKIAVMSCLDAPSMAKAIIGQGASGYISKSAGAGEVRSALHLILAGEIYISPAVLVGKDRESTHHKVILPTDRLAEVLPLTTRQMDVFRLMAMGLPNKSIASRLNCSDGTVKLHVSAILKALHVRNRTEAVQIGMNKLPLKMAGLLEFDA